MSEIILSDDQADALATIRDWYTSGGSTLTLGGYAGTGKTTLLGELRRVIPSNANVYFASYTGKAVSVLSSKIPNEPNVSTLHRLLYKPQPRTVCKVSKEPCIAGMRCSKHTKVSLEPMPSGSPGTQFRIPTEDPCETTKQLDWSQKLNPLDGIDLVVVDEASMISDKIWHDLIKWDVPVLAVGDHGQLPPIKSEFNLMQKPQIKLERILRQAQDSPIIRMATIARHHGELPRDKDFGQGCVSIPRRKMPQYEMDPDAGDLIIVGYNRTRNELNDAMRALLDRKGTPTEGDIVICLRNSYENGIFNGMRGRVKQYEPSSYAPEVEAYAVIEMIDEGFDFSGQVSASQYGQPKTLNDVPRWLNLFDYGYAMTCHKAQGSQADRVMVINEKLPQTDHRRWLYTAITRAAKELVVVT